MPTVLKRIESAIEEDDADACRRALKDSPSDRTLNRSVRAAAEARAPGCLRALLEVTSHANKSESVRNSNLSYALEYVPLGWIEGLDIILSYARSDPPFIEALRTHMADPVLRNHIIDNHKDRLAGWSDVTTTAEDWEYLKAIYKRVPEPFLASIPFDVDNGYYDEEFVGDIPKLIEMEAVCLPALLAQVAIEADRFPRMFTALSDPRIDTQPAMKALTEKIERLTTAKNRLAEAVASKATTAWDMLDD